MHLSFHCPFCRYGGHVDSTPRVDIIFLIMVIMVVIIFLIMVIVES